MPGQQIASMPSSWCQETQDLFTPIRFLGEGGFGSVWLAKQKNSTCNSSLISLQCCKEEEETKAEYDNLHQNSYENTNDCLKVAIKVVGHPHNKKISSFQEMSEAGYFHREISVLQEISHPNIIKCLKVIEDTNPNSSCAPYCMVLEYCRGPTVEQMLNYGGALGIYLAQEVSSQLIDAVCYLHGRAVIHRDIKPDNIIVNGAKLNDEACWSSGEDGEEAAKSMRWNIKLIDFGIARPLRPSDINDEKNVLKKKKEPTSDYFGRSTVDGQLDDRSIHKSNLSLLDLSNHSNKSLLDKSISRVRVRNLSAVGNRNFAAPEVQKGVRLFKNSKDTEKNNKATEGTSRPLTEYVSDYAMIVDAFSTGATIRHMCTGVPPQTSVEEFLQEKNSLVRVLGRKIKKKMHKDGNNKKRTKQYHSNKDLPDEAVRLILGLTHWNEKKRTTIRSARDYKWITSSYSMKNSDTQSNHSADLDFLKCAM